MDHTTMADIVPLPRVARVLMDAMDDERDVITDNLLLLAGDVCMILVNTHHHINHLEETLQMRDAKLFDMATELAVARHSTRTMSQELRRARRHMARQRELLECATTDLPRLRSSRLKRG